MSQNPSENQRELEELLYQLKVEYIKQGFSTNQVMDVFVQNRLISDNCIRFEDIAAVDLQNALAWLIRRNGGLL